MMNEEQKPLVEEKTCSFIIIIIQGGLLIVRRGYLFSVSILKCPLGALPQALFG